MEFGHFKGFNFSNLDVIMLFREFIITCSEKIHHCRSEEEKGEEIPNRGSKNEERYAC